MEPCIPSCLSTSLGSFCTPVPLPGSECEGCGDSCSSPDSPLPAGGSSTTAPGSPCPSSCS
eukprot:12842530-Prorocentrum_lima.AAC.1